LTLSSHVKTVPPPDRTTDWLSDVIACDMFALLSYWLSAM
jgi:hypothetical protein